MESQNSKGDGTYLLKMNENAKNESKSVQWKHGAAVKRNIEGRRKKELNH